MFVKSLGEIIKNRRKELGITQPHLAELAKVSTNTLYKLERGQGNPSLEVLNKLAEVLGLEIALEVKKTRIK
jgi:y4mF family transcriptional regulator